MDVAVAPLFADVVREAGLVAFYVPMHTATRLTSVLAPASARSIRTRICAHSGCMRLYPSRSCASWESSPSSAANSSPPWWCWPNGFRRVRLGRSGRILSNGCSSCRRTGPTSAARTLFADQHRRNPGGGGLHGSQPRLQAPVPALPRRARVRRSVPGGSAGSGAGRYPRSKRRRAPRHITFGDPDFFNGPTHALPIVEAFHREFPDLTYDVTIKVEHLLNHRDLLPVLRDTGCLFVTSAVESLDDAVLALLDKGHTRAGLHRAVDLMRAAGLAMSRRSSRSRPGRRAPRTTTSCARSGGSTWWTT